jgi:hypothetical protein
LTASTQPPATDLSESEIAARLAARYGVDRSAWPRQLLAGTLIIGFLAVAAWVGFQVSDTPYQGKIQRWEPVGPLDGEQLVEIDAEVRGKFDKPLICALRVTETNSADVGYAFVPFDGAPSERTFRIETLTTAASVALLGCGESRDTLRVPPPEYPPGIAPPSNAPVQTSP